jgi:hypothetical protein
MDKTKKTISIHIDVDSPAILSRFYGHTASEYTLSDLETFYSKTFERAFSLFDEFGIKATFFCVGEEIAASESIRNVLKKAHKKGHSIANHTYTHPFGLNLLTDEEILKEITKCSDAIEQAISQKPSGFRVPGYALNTRIINILEENGIAYDSSAGWPLMHILFKFMYYVQKIRKKKALDVGYGETNSYFRKSPYIPHKDNWKKKSAQKRTIKEFPLPASFGLLPFYCNLHATLPSPICNILLNASTHKHLTYLFHIIEFSSMHDDKIPKEILAHPNIQTSYNDKLPRYRNIIRQLLKKRIATLTEYYSNGE